MSDQTVPALPDQAPQPPPGAHNVPQGPSFNFRKRDPNEDVVVPFEMNGQSFTLHPNRVNGLVAGDLPSMRISMDSTPMWDYLEGILGEDYHRFRRMIRDPDLIIEADDFRKMVEWMIGAAGNRPT